MARKPNLNDVFAWSEEHRGEENVAELRARIEADRRLPQPDQLAVGSPERQQAEARQRRIERQAQAIGYQPPVKEMATEVAKEVAIHAAPVAEGVKTEVEVASAGGDAGGELDAEQRRARRRERNRSLSYDGGREFGFGGGFES